MVTINQLLRKKRVTKKIKLNKTPALSGNPQKYGTCLSIFNKTPRKPNSALRKVAKVRLANSKVVNVFIPGEGHNISRFSDVIVVGRRIRDLPGIKYGALRGKLDLSGVLKKRQGRSKYGTKRVKPSGEKGKLGAPRAKSTARILKRAFVKSLRSEVRGFFRSGIFKEKSDAFLLFSKIRSYENFRLLDFSYSRKDGRVERNAQPGMILKKRSLKETIRETYKMVSDARKYKSLKGQDSKDLPSSSSSGKPLTTNSGFPDAGGRFFTLLEVSQSLKFIRVLDSETKRVLRYPL